MKFIEITEELKASPGEYIYHEPTRQVGLCGSFNRTQNQVKVLAQGRLFTDKIENFKKIQLDSIGKKPPRMRRCKGCGK